MVDTFAAHRRDRREGSRIEVVVPPRREPRAVEVRCIGDGTKGRKARQRGASSPYGRSFATP